MGAAAGVAAAGQTITRLVAIVELWRSSRVEIVIAVSRDDVADSDGTLWRCSSALAKWLDREVEFQRKKNRVCDSGRRHGTLSIAASN